MRDVVVVVVVAVGVEDGNEVGARTEDEVADGVDDGGSGTTYGVRAGVFSLFRDAALAREGVAFVPKAFGALCEVDDILADDDVDDDTLGID